MKYSSFSLVKIYNSLIPRGLNGVVINIDNAEKSRRLPAYTSPAGHSSVIKSTPR